MMERARILWLSFLSVTALAVGGDGSDCRGIMRRVRGHVPGAMILNPTLKNFAEAVDPGEGKRLGNDAGLTGSGACHRGTWEPAVLGVQHRVLALGSELTVPHHGWESVGEDDGEEAERENQVAAAAPSFGTMAECAVLRGIRGGFDPSERLFDDQGSHQQPLGVQMAPMTGELALTTKKHDHLSYYGFMWDVRAVRRSIAITGIQMSCTSPKGPFLYRIYASNEPHADIMNLAEEWTLVGEGTVQLPDEFGQITHVPLQQQIHVSAGQTRGIYVHSDNAEGVAYRYNVAMEEGVTDRDDDLEILSGVACYSLQPFEEVYHTTRSFAGSIEYGFI